MSISKRVVSVFVLLLFKCCRLVGKGGLLSIYVVAIDSVERIYYMFVG